MKLTTHQIENRSPAMVPKLGKLGPANGLVVWDQIPTDHEEHLAIQFVNLVSDHFLRQIRKLQSQFAAHEEIF